MSGVFRSHDSTYEILGRILKLGAAVAVWNVKALTNAVIESLDSESIKLIHQSGKTQNKEVRRLVYYAKRRGYLDSALKTTKSGSEKIQQMGFIKLSMDKPWDGKWRIIMFDIPEDKRDIRRQIRRLIKQMGFVQLQQSVWLHPLPCLDEFQRIKESTEFKGSMILVETDDIESANKHKAYFRKLYPSL